MIIPKLSEKNQVRNLRDVKEERLGTLKKGEKQSTKGGKLNSGVRDASCNSFELFFAF